MRKRLTVIPHSHVRDDLLQGSLLPQETLVLPVPGLTELISQFVGLAPGYMIVSSRDTIGMTQAD